MTWAQPEAPDDGWTVYCLTCGRSYTRVTALWGRAWGTLHEHTPGHIVSFLRR